MTRRFLYICAALLLFSSPVLANEKNEKGVIKEDFVTPESMPSVMRVYSQVLQHQMPKGWKPAFRNETNSTFMMEYIPAGETLEDWNLMFTVQGFRDLSGKVTLDKFLSSIAMQIILACGREQSVFLTFPKGKMEEYDLQAIVVGCAKMSQDHPSGLKKGMSEITHMIAIAGKKDIYLLHKAQRGKAFDVKKPPITTGDEALEFMEEFFPIRILDP